MVRKKNRKRRTFPISSFLKLTVLLGYLYILLFITLEIVETHYFDKLFYLKSWIHGYYFPEKDSQNTIAKLLAGVNSEGFRDSEFRPKQKGEFLILVVGDSNVWGWGVRKSNRFTQVLEKELSKFAKPPYSIQNVAQAVINTRMVKMPDWTKIGTAGSFFKNPFVTREKYLMLSAQIKELQAYPTEKMLYPTEVDSDLVKIPAGRLLDELGWRNKTIGRVSTFEKHALVIVNLGGATGQEIYDYTEMMREDIRKNFDIELEYEVRVI